MLNPAAALVSTSYVVLGAAVGIAEGCLQALVCPLCTAGAEHSAPPQTLEACLGVLLPIVVLGDSGVGKTRLCQLFVARALPRSTSPTVVADLFITEAAVRGRPVIVQLWDVGGREAAARLAPRFFESATGAMLVYAAADPAAADSLAFWHAELARKAASFGRLRLALVALGAGSAGSELGTQAAQRWCRRRSVRHFAAPGDSCAGDLAAVDAALGALCEAALALRLQQRQPRVMAVAEELAALQAHLHAPGASPALSAASPAGTAALAPACTCPDSAEDQPRALPATGKLRPLAGPRAQESPPAWADAPPKVARSGATRIPFAPLPC